MSYKEAKDKYAKIGFQVNDLWDTKDNLIEKIKNVSVQKNLILVGRSYHTSPKKIRGRVMAFLNSASLQHGSREFEIPFDRQQMADYLNLERTALSKELGRMKKEGLIDYHKNRFRILSE